VRDGPEGFLEGVLVAFWFSCCSGGVVSRPVELPDEKNLIDALKTMRRRGITKLGELEVEALRQVVRAAGRVGHADAVGSYVMEAMLRDAVAQLGGDHAEAAALLFGLAPGARSDRPSKLREEAAAIFGVGGEHFRHQYEPELIGQIGQLLLGEAHRYQLRLQRLRQDVRTPVGSRLAVEWLSRFEAMYRIWTPVHALGADLSAFRSTLLDEDRPWDGHLDADHPDERYTQERQAAGYVTTAFFWRTSALAALRRFEIGFGGLWVLPDAQAETDLADAMYRIALASPNGPRDDSYLRMLLSRVPDEELHAFLTRVAEDEIGMKTHEEWLEWAFTCDCRWVVGERRGRERFPTHRNHQGISPQCDVHMVVDACNDFCLVLDDAWDNIADWYHEVPRPERRDVTAEEVHALRGSPLPRYLVERKEGLAED
jgi:hypothetical protein